MKILDIVFDLETSEPNPRARQAVIDPLIKLGQILLSVHGRGHIRDVIQEVSKRSGRHGVALMQIWRDL